MKHSIIIGGENYGQGSSREHAAMLPMYLGTEVVIAKSFARIHKENLFNYGIIPLIFVNNDDYDKIQQEDKIVIDDVIESIHSGKFIVKVPEKNIEIEAKLEASDYDKMILIYGGTLNYLADKIKNNN